MKRRIVELRIRILTDLPLQEFLRVHEVRFMEADGCESWVNREDATDAEGKPLDKIVSTGAHELDTTDPREW